MKVTDTVILENEGADECVRYTRSGARRAGDEYQDIIALDLVVQMLEHPKDFHWIKVEANEAGFLDDVFALLSDGKYVARQVKFATDASVSWSWKDLLEQTSPTGSSLIKKWFLSWERIRYLGNINEVSLWTNRMPSANLKKCLNSTNKINLQKTPKYVRQELSAQLGAEKNITAFFKNFSFNFEAPTIEEMHKGVRRRFFRLGGDELGWASLSDAMRRWVRLKNEPQPDGKIDLRAARFAAGWFELRELPQSFEIPRDYVLPLRSFHSHVLSRINKLRKGCLVITSPPGLGKSTYLSFLTKTLRRRKIPVIRHHYYLSISDKSGDRFDHRRVIESLMSEIQQRYSDALEENEAVNPSPSESNFAEWIKKTGEYLSCHGKLLVIIIDGLDHVFREQKNIRELNTLFNYLLPAEKGIFVIVGTQPVVDEYLPSRLIEIMPRQKWVELPNLGLNAIKKWVKFHAEELKIASDHDDDYWINEAASGFFKISGGHPLVLRYSLSAIIERGLWATKESILSLTQSTTREVDSYYSSLWRGLEPNSRTILCLMSTCPFEWPDDGILECLTTTISERTEFIEALRIVRHLFVEASIGLRPFHPSLHLFIKNTEEYRLHHVELKRRVLAWLKNQAPDYLRWSYVWRLEAELGNPESVKNGPSREWAIESLSKRFPEKDALDIMYLAGKFALEDRELPKYIEHGLLRDYYQNSLEYQGDAIHTMLEAQLHLKEDPKLVLRLSSDLTTLDDEEFLMLARSAYFEGNQHLVSQIFKCINDRLSTSSRRDLAERSAEITTRIAALSNEVSIERLIDYITRQRRQHRNIDELSTYCDECLRSGNVKRLQDLLAMRKRLESNETAIVMRYLSLYAIDNGIDIEGNFPKSRINDPEVELYRFLKKLKAPRSNLQFPSTHFLDLREYEIYQQTDSISSLFSRCFFIFVVNHCIGDYQKNLSWLESIGTSNWPRRFLHKINSVAQAWSVSLLDGNPVSYSWFFDTLQDFQKPDWRDDENYRYSFTADDFVIHTSFDTIRYGNMIGQRPQISKSDIEAAFASRFIQHRQWLNKFLDLNRNWITPDAVDWIIEHGIEDMQKGVEQFSERASALTNLAILAARYNKDDKCKQLIRCVSDNLLAYGGHKDLLLSSVLDSILSCHRTGINRVLRWLHDLAPAISEIENYTDGDETGYIPQELGDVLLEVNAEWFVSYHGWLLHREEYYDALTAFHSFLEKAELSTELNQCLAKTAIDEQSLKILKRRTEAGDTGAQMAFSYIEGVFGPIRLEEEEQRGNRSGDFQHREESKLPDPLLYPPDQFHDYINALGSDRPYDLERPLMNWLRQWVQGTDTIRAMELVEGKMNNGTYHDLSDLMLDLTVQYRGPEIVYPILVKAYISNSGWSRYFSSFDKAKKYWQVLKTFHSEKWYEFIRDTMFNPYDRSFFVTGSTVFYRLVEFLLFFGQQELAANVTETAVSFSKELVSPLALKSPEWIKQYENS